MHSSTPDSVKLIPRRLCIDIEWNRVEQVRPTHRSKGNGAYGRMALGKFALPEDETATMAGGPLTTNRVRQLLQPGALRRHSRPGVRYVCKAWPEN